LAISYWLLLKQAKQLMQNFRDLKVWQKAHAMVLAIYQQSGTFPRNERFGLINQIRRAAVSVAANIAEGATRSSDADFARFLHIAMGSASEVDYYLLLARDLKYLDAESHAELDAGAQEVKRMLNALITRVRANS
jgi:four helix bundle protein